MRLDGRLPVLAGTAAGLVAAAVLTLLQPSTYRADASIALVRQGQPPGDDPALAQAAEAAVELFHSRAVAEPAIANLRLEESPAELLDRVSVETRAESSLVRVVVDAPSQEDARRAAQEVVEVATVLFNDRFGPETAATIWEPARAEDGRASPRPARNVALGALLGALVGWGLAASRWRRARQPTRVEPAARPEPTAPPPAPPLPAPALEPQPHPAPTEPERPGEWTTGGVERLLAEQGDAFPERREELATYLAAFREVAEPDGRLPHGVQGIAEEVFADLVARQLVAREADPAAEEARRKTQREGA